MFRRLFNFRAALSLLLLLATLALWLRSRTVSDTFTLRTAPYPVPDHLPLLT